MERKLSIKKRRRARGVFLCIAAVALCAGIIGSAAPLLARAQNEQGQTTGYVPLAPLPGTRAGEQASAPTTLPIYFRGLYRLIIGLSAALAVIMLMIAGLQYMSTDAIGGKSDAKKQITGALAGLGLLLISVLLLETINKDLVNFTIGPIFVGNTITDSTKECVAKKASDVCRDLEGVPVGPLKSGDRVDCLFSNSTRTTEVSGRIDCASSINTNLPYDAE